MSTSTHPHGVRVCSLDEVQPGTAAQATIDGRVVAIVRDEDGGVHCIDDECTHGKVSLSEGEVEGCTLECWLHGSQFDLVSGRPTGLPATIPVTVHTVTVVDDDVYVTLSDGSTDSTGASA